MLTFVLNANTATGPTAALFDTGIVSQKLQLLVTKRFADYRDDTGRGPACGKIGRARRSRRHMGQSFCLNVDPPNGSTVHSRATVFSSPVSPKSPRSSRCVSRSSLGGGLRKGVVQLDSSPTLKLYSSNTIAFRFPFLIGAARTWAAY